MAGLIGTQNEPYLRREWRMALTESDCSFGQSVAWTLPAWRKMRELARGCPQHAFQRPQLPGLVVVRNRSGRPGSSVCAPRTDHGRTTFDDLEPSRVVAGAGGPDGGQGRAPGSTCARQPGSSAVQV